MQSTNLLQTDLCSNILTEAIIVQAISENNLHDQVLVLHTMSSAKLNTDRFMSHATLHYFQVLANYDS